MMRLPLHQIIPTLPPVLYDRTLDASHTTLWSYHGRDIHLHSLFPLKRLSPSPIHVSASQGSFKGWRISHLQPLGSSNLVLLVLDKKPTRASVGASYAGVDDGPTFSRFVLYDARAKSPIFELSADDSLRSSTRILNVVARNDKVLLVHKRRVILYHLNLNNMNRKKVLTREGIYETCDNPLGLASISTCPGSDLLAIPGRQIGQVQIVRLPPCPSSLLSGNSRATRENSTTTPPYPIIRIYLCHSSPLRTIKISETGHLLITASKKGTLLRIFSTAPSSPSASAATSTANVLLKELRRGSDSADIWDVGFADPTRGLMVYCVSDKETVHVWKIGDLRSAATPAEALASGGKAPTSKGKHRSVSITKGESAPVPSTASQLGYNPKLSALQSVATNLFKPYLPAYFQSQWSDLIWRIPKNTNLYNASSKQENPFAASKSSERDGGAFTLLPPSLLKQSFNMTPSTPSSAKAGQQRRQSLNAGGGFSDDDFGLDIPEDDGVRLAESIAELRSTEEKVLEHTRPHSRQTSSASGSSSRVEGTRVDESERQIASHDDIAKCVFVHVSPPRVDGSKSTAEDFELIVFTRSGAWFRLSVSPGAISAKSASDKENIHKRKSALQTHGDQAREDRCSLLEYKRIVATKKNCRGDISDAEAATDGSEDQFQDHGGYGDMWSDEE